MPAGDLVFLDDHAPNIEAAREAGWRGVVFSDARQAEAELRSLGWWPWGACPNRGEPRARRSAAHHPAGESGHALQRGLVALLDDAQLPGVGVGVEGVADVALDLAALQLAFPRVVLEPLVAAQGVEQPR